ncbi:MAG: class I SAM-dependent methyltransferase [Zavarzinella sp.]
MSKVLYKVDKLPLFQNKVYPTYEQAITAEVGSLELVHHPVTGHIYNQLFESERVIYDIHYDNEQSHSAAFQAHLKDVAQLIIQEMGKDNLVEVGCGKGFFLDLLLAQGCDVTGFDPSFAGDHPRIRRKYFAPEDQFQANGLVLRHVLEHILHPHQFLQMLRVANGGHGLIYIEVPCLDWIISNGTWWDIFYEHVNYFRLSDLTGMFDNVHAAGRCFGEQYLYLIADLGSLRTNFEIRHEFSSESLKCLQPIIDTAKIDPTKEVVWGAASKGVIYSLHRKRLCLPVKQIVDINPNKQGKYLPVTGLQVQSPAECLSMMPADTVIRIMNSNYLNEIQQSTGNRFQYETI